MQSMLDWNDTCAIARCVSCEHETTNLYSFRKQSCCEQCGSGVESSRVIKDQRNELAANLTHGDWMMFESPELNVQPFWIGRAISKSEWNNSCFYKNNTTRRKNLMGNLPLDPGEYAVNVQWYNQQDIGSSLEYTVDRTNPYPIVNHNHTWSWEGLIWFKLLAMQSDYRDRERSNLGMNLGIIFLNKICKQEKGIGTEENLEMFID
jgi:hypothetical protein